MSSYQQILNQVKQAVFQVFDKIPQDNFRRVHSFAHVQRVAANARQIVKLEAGKLVPRMGLTPSDFAFLVELAAWLHDLGRTVEAKPSRWGDKFNHAAESAKMAKKILTPLHTSDLGLVLQAVAEHNQPSPEHPKNLITRVLQDADRGDGFSYMGMIMVLRYNRVIPVSQIETESASRRVFLKYLPELKNSPEKRRRTLHWLKYLSSWYTGGRALSPNGRGQFAKGKVCPLFTAAAKRIYRPGFLTIQKYLKMLQKIESGEEHIIKKSKIKKKDSFGMQKSKITKNLPF